MEYSRRYYYVEIFGRARPAFYHTHFEGKGTRGSVLLLLLRPARAVGPPTDFSWWSFRLKCLSPGDVKTRDTI